MKNKSNHKDTYFDVESIISRKCNGKNKLYLIKWAGYPIKECTWEPITHLHKIINLVENFEKNFPNSINKRFLKNYLRATNNNLKRKIKRKNQYIKNRDLKNRNNIKNNHIIIDLQNSVIINEENKIKEETENKEQGDNLDIKIIEIEELKTDINESTNDITLEENSNIKLRRPILIW